MRLSAVRFAVMVAFVTVAASVHAQTGNWGNFAVISDTLGNHAGRLCVGEGLRVSDIGCPSYAPSLTTAGDVSVTGNLSANKFIGDGSLLTGVGQSDRIVSGSTNVIAMQDRSVTISTVGTQRVLIGENGRIGIGTNNPTSDLDVSRSAAGALTTIKVENRNPTGWAQLSAMADSASVNLGFTGSGTATGPIAYLQTGTPHPVVIYTANVPRLSVGSSGGVAIGAGIVVTPTATLQVSGSFIVSTSAQNTTPSLYVGSSGNVGIGTSSPGGNRLAVHGEADTGILVQNSGGNVAQMTLFNGTPGGHMYSFRSWGSASNYDLSLDNVSTSSRVMTITSRSSIGIGTASPGSSLTVVGEVKVGSSGSACVTTTNAGAIRYSGGSIYYCNASNTWTAVGAAGVATAASSTGAVQFNVANGLAGDTSNLFWDDTNNRLGIGTSSPAGLLTVSGTLGEVTIDSNGAVMSMTRPGINYFGASQNAPLYLMTSNTGRIIITGLGNVGIGTSAPSATLTVSGSAIVSGTIQVAGAATETCTAGKLGTLRFNPVTGAPQICVQR